ncbi:hypothetical protein SUDANB145_06781 [Streptomyces sp. enrichment culture]
MRRRERRVPGREGWVRAGRERVVGGPPSGPVDREGVR